MVEAPAYAGDRCDEDQIVQVGAPAESNDSTAESVSRSIKGETTGITSILSTTGLNSSVFDLTSSMTGGNGSSTTTLAGIGEEVVIGGTTYTIGPLTSTVTANGIGIVLGPGNVVIANQTIALPASATGPVAISAGGITLTLEPVPAPRPTSSLVEVLVIGSSTYTVGSGTFTVTADGTTFTVEPSDIIIGSNTISFPPSPTGPVIISTNGIELTLSPQPAPGSSPTVGTSAPTSSPGPTAGTSLTTGSSASTSNTGPTPGSSPTVGSPAPTSTSSTTGPPPSIIVETLTALDGATTTEVTLEATTLFPFLTLTSTSTFTTVEDGVPTVIVVGPFGIAWECVDCTSISGFPTVTFPPIPPPAPSPTATGGPISTSASNPFPSSQFPLPPFITTVITVTGPSGVIVVTETQTTNSNGVLVPVSTLKSSAASSLASALASDVHSASGVVEAFSRAPSNPTSARSAKAAAASAHSEADEFGRDLGIAAAGLCLLFCPTVGTIAGTLGTLEGTIDGVAAGTLGAGVLGGLLGSLGGAADELEEETRSSTTASPQSSSSSTSSSSSSSSTCSGRCSTCYTIAPLPFVPQDEDDDLLEKRYATAIAGRIEYDHEINARGVLVRRARQKVDRNYGSCSLGTPVTPPFFGGPSFVSKKFDQPPPHWNTFVRDAEYW